MAVRYSGDLEIRLMYRDRARGSPNGYYDIRILQDGAELWRDRVDPSSGGFGPGVAYDSRRAYNAMAKEGLAFAAADEEEADPSSATIRSAAEYTRSGSGEYRIRTEPYRARYRSRRTIVDRPSLNKIVALARDYRNALFRAKRAGRPIDIHRLDTLVVLQDALSERYPYFDEMKRVANTNSVRKVVLFNLKKALQSRPPKEIFHVVGSHVINWETGRPKSAGEPSRRYLPWSNTLVVYTASPPVQRDVRRRRARVR